MSFEISSVNALEILDSRGRPTLNVTVALVDGTRSDTTTKGSPAYASCSASMTDTVDRPWRAGRP